MKASNRLVKSVVLVLGVFLLVGVRWNVNRRVPGAGRLRAGSSRRLDIFGTDDRRVVSDATLFPYSAVGLLRWSEDRFCTASLIGSRFVVSAAECVLTPDGKKRPSTFDKPEFVVGYGESTTSDGSGAEKKTAKVVKVHKQSDFWEKWTQETYVILELDKALGESHGILSLPTLDELDQSLGSTPVQIVGFDEEAKDESTASLKFAKCTCYFPTSFNGSQFMLHHDCDTSATGSPGSPLLVRYANMETYIIGLHSNAIGSTTIETETKTFPKYSNSVANRGVLGPFIQKHMEALKNTTTSSSNSSTTDASSSSSGHSVTESSSSGYDIDNREAEHSKDRDTDTTGSESVQDAAKEARTLSPTTAYACIGAVGFAWACILFIALKHLGTPTLCAREGDLVPPPAEAPIVVSAS
ncbi:hypothetical protein Poli38472_002693 [Pythium oligandrum]|uniref:Peptidase S1 domain-containing protein n=1 Tax=Pythium oligandrum TaxID=41045 RepID=A0A8K1FLE2_PYTOL|nr:hypothetical protein Poli38472_002693 [Pythium oligandrum]|eukprot:TMW63752.1 hypothetical protein Poli38472_002693 [Pythium oligandrum]